MSYCQRTTSLCYSAVCGICSLPVGTSLSRQSLALSDWPFPSHIRSSLREQLRSLKQLSQTLGIHDYLEDTCSNLTRGALDALSIFLPHAPPSDDLLVALKCRFHHKVMSRTPSSSRKALGSIHGYLMVGYHIYVRRRSYRLQLATQSWISTMWRWPYSGITECPWRRWTTAWFWSLFASKEEVGLVGQGMLIWCTDITQNYRYEIRRQRQKSHQNCGSNLSTKRHLDKYCTFTPPQSISGL